VRHCRKAFLLSSLLIFAAVSANPCDLPVGYFHQVTALRGQIVGLKAGVFQYSRSLRQSFKRNNVRLILYQYRSGDQRPWMPIVKIIHADQEGHFDFGPLAPGHYTLEVDDKVWDTESWFDVEVLIPMPQETASVTVDISPNFPNCRGGQEMIVHFQ